MDDQEIDKLQQRLGVACGQLNVAHAGLVELIHEAICTAAWAQPGVCSVEHWVAWQTGLSPERAKQFVMIARRHDDLPITFSTFANGELAIDQIAQVARYTAPHNDAEACYLATQATVVQLRSALSRHQPAWLPTTEPNTHGDDATPSDDAKANDDSESEPAGDPSDGAGDADGRDDADHADHADHAGAAAADLGQVTMWFDDDGRYQFHADCPADIGALIDTAMREARNALINAGNTNVTWMDALAEVCNRSLGGIRSTSRADKYRIYIHLDATTEPPTTTNHETETETETETGDRGEPTVASDDPEDRVEAPSDQVQAKAEVEAEAPSDEVDIVARPVAPARAVAPARVVAPTRASRSGWATNRPPGLLLPAWLNAGPGLTDSVRDHLCCDTIIRPVFYRDGKPVNLGRATRTVRNDLRRLILERDRHCRYPGCTSAAHLEVHHLVHWIKGGPTDTFNLAALCPQNHRGTHIGDYTASGNADLQDGIVWRQRNGAIIPATGTPIPPTSPLPEPPPGHAYHHPTGETFRTKFWQLDNSPEQRQRLVTEAAASASAWATYHH